MSSGSMFAVGGISVQAVKKKPKRIADPREKSMARFKAPPTRWGSRVSTAWAKTRLKIVFFAVSKADVNMSGMPWNAEFTVEDAREATVCRVPLTKSGIKLNMVLNSLSKL